MEKYGEFKWGISHHSWLVKFNFDEKISIVSSQIGEQLKKMVSHTVRENKYNISNLLTPLLQ